MLRRTGSSLSDSAMDGRAVAITAPSNWCMNCAQPTIRGAMIELREPAEGDIARGSTRRSAPRQAWTIDRDVTLIAPDAVFVDLDTEPWPIGHVYMPALDTN